MTQTYPILFASLTLLALCARALALALRYRRTPGPAAEQLLEGVSLGILIALGGLGIFALIVAA